MISAVMPVFTERATVDLKIAALHFCGQLVASRVWERIEDVNRIIRILQEGLSVCVGRYSEHLHPHGFRLICRSVTSSRWSRFCSDTGYTPGQLVNPDKRTGRGRRQLAPSSFSCLGCCSCRSRRHHCYDTSDFGDTRRLPHFGKRRPHAVCAELRDLGEHVDATDKAQSAQRCDRAWLSRGARSEHVQRVEYIH